MGTNFYLKQQTAYGELTNYDDSDDPIFHIGKRSAAGYYCWDCGITLCKGGNKSIHTSEKFFDKCPICKKPPEDEDISSSSGGRELGFNKSKPKSKTGVKTCSSFTWAQDPKIIDGLPKRGKPIINEYNETFSVKEFKEILKECPVQYTDLIGRWFS